MTAPIRVGVIGANAARGWAAETHLPALTALPQYELAAVATNRIEVATAAAERWGAPRALDDPYALIRDPDVDLITIAVQLPRRDDLVSAAIAAGKHVYCEWPLELGEQRAAALRDRAVKAGVRHAVGLQSRHHPAVRYLRALIDEGRIGEVLSATLTYSSASASGLAGNRLPERYAWLTDRSRGVNTLTIAGGHSIDMFRSIVGDFRQLSATLATRVRDWVVAETGAPLVSTSPDQVLVQGLLECGAVADVRILTGGENGTGLSVEVVGREGRLVLRPAGPSLVFAELSVAYGKGFDELVALPVPEQYRRVLPEAPPAVRNVASVYTELAAAIHEGTELIPSFDTAASMHRLLDTIARAAETGTRQDLS